MSVCGMVSSMTIPLKFIREVGRDHFAFRPICAIISDMQSPARYCAVGLMASLLTLSLPAATTPLVNHGDAWRFHKGTNAPQAGWTNVPDAALDATWSLGHGGFGYADAGILRRVHIE